MPREAAEFTTITMHEPSRGTTRARTVHLAMMWSIRGLAWLIIFAACVSPAILFYMIYELAGRPPYPRESFLSGLLGNTVTYMLFIAGLHSMPLAYTAFGQVCFPLLYAHSYLQRLAKRSTGEVADAVTRFPVLVTLEPRAATPTLADKDPWDDFGLLTIAREGLSFHGSIVSIDAPREAVQAMRVGHRVDSIFSAESHIMLILRSKDGLVGVQLSAIGVRTSRSLITQQYQLVAALEQDLDLTTEPLG